MGFLLQSHRLSQDGRVRGLYGEEAKDRFCTSTYQVLVNFLLVRQDRVSGVDVIGGFRDFSIGHSQFSLSLVYFRSLLFNQVSSKG